jgi:hypothetical protein
MKSLKIFVAAGFAVFMLALGPTASVRGEPMPTLIGFDRSTYDARASSQIVVTITRDDPEPSVGASAEFSVDCTITGGTAAEGVDYRLVFDGAVRGLGTITFPPGVRAKSFTISALSAAGRTIEIGLTNPQGPAPVELGDNAVAKITIYAPAR